jgi:hypothetical protein
MPKQAGKMGGVYASIDAGDGDASRRALTNTRIELHPPVFNYSLGGR